MKNMKQTNSKEDNPYNEALRTIDKKLAKRMHQH